MNKIIKRSLQGKLEKWLFKGKVLIVYGARQVGKTTLVKALLEKHRGAYFNCDIIQIRQALEKQDPWAIKKFFGNQDLIVLDEAQRVPDIGLTLKMMVDTYPETQIIATGSSSFDLSNRINEPLTGRALEFCLYPFSLRELGQIYPDWQRDSQLENFLRFGMYPEIVLEAAGNAQIFLDNLASKYLYKDALEFENIKRPDLVVNLLQLLALQIGNEVSMNEIANSLGCNRDTVIHYLDILEKAFVIFRLGSFSRNLRSEIGKKQKVYFYDLGVRNSLIGRYAPLSAREDIGGLWENFCVAERLKYLQEKDSYAKRYFWRTHTQKEIDYLEECEGILAGYEFKWNKKTFTRPKEFLETYPRSSISLINRFNYHEFLGIAGE